MAMAEVHLVDDALHDMVTQGAPMAALKQHIYRDRVVPLAVQAMHRVLAGNTTLEEIRRVIGWL
jgi:type II secretory ATPase GspE/PulE/Tfp pilus assembly ATPase PilB-like protein